MGAAALEVTGVVSASASILPDKRATHASVKDGNRTACCTLAVIRVLLMVRAAPTATLAEAARVVRSLLTHRQPIARAAASTLDMLQREVALQGTGPWLHVIRIDTELLQLW